MPGEVQCANCLIENCPFSEHKSGGSWDNELGEYDPRRDFFTALLEHFEQMHPGYTLKGFLCSDIVPDGELWIEPAPHFDAKEKYTFVVYAPQTFIRALLMREVQPENWEEYVTEFVIKIKRLDSDPWDDTPEALKKAFEGLEYVETAEAGTTKKSLLERLKAVFFKR